MIKAITFDLWDTVIHDDSDEPKRAARGLLPKAQARPEILCSALNLETSVSQEKVALAYAVQEAAFRHVWHEQHVTWTVAERLEVVLSGLGLTLSEAHFRDVQTALEEMELQVKPNPVAGMPQAIAMLAEHYQLAVVSDAIYTPGRCLREWLQGEGVLDYFSAFAFSDEIGHSKPHRSMFDHVAQTLGVDIGQMLHIGDRDHNDVKGPQALGMQAVLFAATRNKDRDITSAEAICDDPANLFDIIQQLAKA